MSKLERSLRFLSRFCGLAASEMEELHSKLLQHKHTFSFRHMANLAATLKVGTVTLLLSRSRPLSLNERNVLLFARTNVSLTLAKIF